MGSLWTSEENQVEPIPVMCNITPVRYICSKCGWASPSLMITCTRCEQQLPKWISFEKEQLSKTDSFEKDSKNSADVKFFPFRKDVNVFQKMKNANRRSRCLSRTFTTNVISPLGVSVPFSIKEEDMEYSTSPAVREIVELIEKNREGNGDKIIFAIENILSKEKSKGTSWREIADETIMELIIHDVNGYSFVQALIRTYNISAYEVGKFIATPLDEETMSLLEEATLQENLELFDEILKTKGVMQGALECAELSDEVRKILQTII